MWFFKVLPALYGLFLNSTPQVPASGIEVVNVANLVVQAPKIWPTVTVAVGSE